MKKVIYMAVAAIAVLSSCSSEEFTQSSNGNNNGEAKVFTGTIESDGAATRTTLADDGSGKKKANWVSGDKVNIGGAEYTAASGGATTTFTGSGATQESGKYKAYYPSTMYNEGTITLPVTYTYDGNFNMPMYAESSTTDLSFQNICGVLAITVPANTVVSRIQVTSDNPICGACTISSTGEGDSKKYTATATGANVVTLNFTTARTIAEGGETFYLPITADSHKLTVGIDNGTDTYSYMSTSAAVTIERSNIYSVSFEAKHSVAYVKIGDTKWATMNLGATEVAESAAKSYGDYYAWGATETWYSGAITWDNYTTGSISASSWKTGHTDGYTNSYSCPSVEVDSNLPLANDIAYQTYGGNWCIPTSTDFDNLHVACGGTSGDEYDFDNDHIISSDFTASKGEYWINYKNGGITASTSSMSLTMKVPGVLFCDGSNMVFFPAAGDIGSVYGDAKALAAVGTAGCYWSSTQAQMGPGLTPYYLLEDYNNEEPYLSTTDGRNYYYGLQVRPVLK